MTHNGFLRSHTPRYPSKEEQVRDLMLIRLVCANHMLQNDVLLLEHDLSQTFM